MASITQLEMNMTSGQRVKPVIMEAAEVSAAIRVSALMGILGPRQEE
ncbi:TPA: hypothetical protein OT855_000802 [Serratia liquefaciens]|nr:hypothetical protein [Serratia liquefaciens]